MDDSLNTLHPNLPTLLPLPGSIRLFSQVLLELDVLLSPAALKDDANGKFMTTRGRTSDRF